MTRRRAAAGATQNNLHSSSSIGSLGVSAILAHHNHHYFDLDNLHSSNKEVRRRKIVWTFTFLILICFAAILWRASCLFQRDILGSVVVEIKDNSQVQEKTRRTETVLKSDAVTQSPSQNHFFDWSDVDLLPRHGDCGEYKCFFKSKSNDKLGYLIGDADDNYDAMVAAVHLAHDLEQRFGAKHLYCNDCLPNRVVVSSPILFAQLQAAVHQPLRQLANRTATRVFQQSIHEKVTLVIQIVKRAPKPVLTYGCCMGTKPLALQRELPSFAKHIPNMTLFLKNLRADREVVAKALNEHDTLWSDFQGLIDVKGNFWMIDLDGGHDVKILPHRQKRSYVRKRIALLDDIMRQLINITIQSRSSTKRP